MKSADASDILAAALFEQKVFVWKTSSATLICALDTELDAGGHRLAISADGSQLYTGSFDEKCVRCRDIVSGNVIWELPGIGEVQRLRFNARSKTIQCGIEEPITYVIDARNGRVIRRLTGTEWFVEDSTSTATFHIRKPMQMFHGNELAFIVSNETFAVLTADFGAETIAFSESGGDVRCLSTEDGREMWRYKPRYGYHVLDLAYFRNHGRYYAIEWHYLRAPAEMTLLRFDEPTGYVEHICEFPPMHAFSFSKHEEVLYSSNGSALDIRTGELVKQLPFKDVIGARE